MSRKTNWVGACCLWVVAACTPEGTAEQPTAPQTDPQPVAQPAAFALVELFSSEG
ncbi:MAG: hypothetical protein KTR31_18155 [Myxococcales bacterium]|nr:hypothetical protein [Myxococcales bacterium]